MNDGTLAPAEVIHIDYVPRYCLERVEPFTEGEVVYSEEFDVSLRVEEIDADGTAWAVPDDGDA